MKLNLNNSNPSKIKGFPVSLDELISLTPTIVKQVQSPVFTLALAHEIRNPLTNIHLAVEILQSTTSEEERQMCLDIVSRGSFRINDIITNLLANYEVVEMPLEVVKADKLLDEALALSKDRIKLRGITVNKVYAGKDCKILVYKSQILIALINIIINAIDAMATGKGALKVITRSIKGICIIAIEDNGIGISKKNLKNIFKPYFTNKPGGMGLGLSTTLTTLLSNHARVKVYSEEGRGTRFVLFFEKISTVEEVFK